MSGSGAISLLLGLLILACSVPPAVAPVSSLERLKRFPRSRVSAWVLTAAALCWSGYLLYRMEMGRFNAVKPHFVYLVPAAVFVVARYMDELLAPRALGALLLLLPAPLLAGMRWHSSPFRYIAIVAAYAMAIEGIVLVLSPYRFRWAVQWCEARPRAFRAACLLGSGLGLLLTALAFTAFAGA